MRKPITFALLVFGAALGGGCARLTEPNARSADVSADYKKLQGAWRIDTFDNGRTNRPEAEKARDLEDLKYVRFQFEGNRMTILDNGREEFTTRFALDEKQDPKVMAHLRASADEPARGTARGTTRSTFRGTSRSGDAPTSQDPNTWKWIYKFDGDALVVAFTRDDKKAPPKEFKARPDVSEPGKPDVSGVVLMTLKKVNGDAPGSFSGTARSGTSRGTYRSTSRGTTK